MIMDKGKIAVLWKQHASKDGHGYQDKMHEVGFANACAQVERIVAASAVNLYLKAKTRRRKKMEYMRRAVLQKELAKKEGTS